MSAIDYARLKGVADDLLGSAGKTMQLRRIVAEDGTTSQSATAVDQDSATNDADCVVAFFDYKDQDIDGLLIVAGDRRALIAVGELEAAPKFGDILIDGSDQYKIILASKVSPAGVDVLYKCQVRS